MFKEIKKTLKWGETTLTLETGKVARQAHGSVIVTLGETVVLCAVTAQKTAKEGAGFFPLTVNYIEKYYAAGKIPGGFFKREGRPTEKETLTSRLIDRPIRPLFPDGFQNEVQVVCMVISHDMENNPDIAALIGASAALVLSGVPFQEAIAGARVGFLNGSYILNPTFAQMEETQLDLVVAGTETSVLMVESEADELSEAEMLGAVNFGHEAIQPVIKLIKELGEEAASPAWEFDPKDNSTIFQEVSTLAEADLRAAYKITDKQARTEALEEVRNKVKESFTANELVEMQQVEDAIKSLEKHIVRNDILDTGKRIDGRDTKTVRPIMSEVGILPRTHGSSLFTRGETQAIVVTTLGTGQDEQIIDTLDSNSRQNFMLHYNFPPYSVGEAYMLRPPGRREIGHGKLAWRALKTLMPAREDFPYTVRIVSEITESNGSSSMATVCGASLSLMEAGVPIRRPVAGIAMGLIKEGAKFAVLSDILGDEDHLGDMDFKVAGTSEGITALQMDIKISGITTEIMQIALDQAQEGRLHILDKMAECITESREELNENAPIIVNMDVHKDKIRDIIGQGGKTIREICEVSGASVDIDDEGNVKVFAVGKEALDIAVNMIEDIIAEPEIGAIYSGPITKLMDFGAFVKFLGKNEGLVHISEVEDGRIENINDVLNEGDEVKVKVLGMDRGKVRLSMRVVDQVTGEDISSEVEERPFRPSGDKRRGDKRGGKKRFNNA